MAVQLIDARGQKRTSTSEYLLELIGDGNESEIEGFEDEECLEEEGIDSVPDRVAGQSYSDDEISNSEREEEATNIQVPEIIRPSLNTVCVGSQRGRGDSQRGGGPSQRNRGVCQRGRSVSRRHHLPDRSPSAPTTSHGNSRHRTRDRMSRNDQLLNLSGTSPPLPSVRAQSEVTQRNRDPSRRRLWKSIPFDQKEHNFPPRNNKLLEGLSNTSRTILTMHFMRKLLTAQIITT
ncbi:uncharacterized protein LOC111350844 [Spodoptera litura]|uniref:Uncharacterized protein LOC111350844 n=1 Tax=Spodoptera litura TaxID=69820 RepID=A0A9J7IMH1_SPOLT|nr:uncharacterized protein LOC111350844 [Spodoptera litura]XP_022818311.1 uncharacterized protein LOC111350844 [Spodoptera litura]